VLGSAACDVAEEHHRGEAAQRRATAENHQRADGIRAAPRDTRAPLGRE